MNSSRLVARLGAGLALLASPQILAAAAAPTAATLPSEIPAAFSAPEGLQNYVRRDVMIPMRDGVKLHTVILIPKGAKNAPMLLTRTPYGATSGTSRSESGQLESVLGGASADIVVQGGYIRVIQDVRGKYGSEGDYVMNRPLRGPLNPTAVDHATDTWDTIDWLVRKVPESNGKVGIYGISYDGFTTLMALVDPHPALKVAVPMNPMVDGWMGDDWFHKGASRINYGLDYVYQQESSRSSDHKLPNGDYDTYDDFLKAGPAANLGKIYNADQFGFWNKLLAHPAYDAFWREQALDKILAKRPLKVPTLLVHSLWDQEDIYGAMAVYKAIKPKDVDGNMVYLAIGPWRHGGEAGEGSSLGAVKFDQDTAKQFRMQVMAPFLAHYLKDDAPPLDIAPVTAFETGANVWRRLDRWPVAGEGRRLYLHAGAAASFTPPGPSEAPFDDYVSDPAKPVPYRDAIIRPTYASDSTWSRWLVDDQRFASRRPDVLVFETEALTAPLKLAGEPVANIVAATTGTDGDFVVKVIDVYPAENPSQREMGGYQLAVSMDILRGRYRESFSDPKPITPNAPLAYRFALPTTNHVFLPGHKIMVQIQSSWFPLYDRNPQTFTPNIFFAPPEAYRRATIKVFHDPAEASYVELPVAP
jgi:putative CocE/NonD family hydrolase